MPTANAVTFRATQITIYDWSNRHQRPCHRTSEYLLPESILSHMHQPRLGAAVSCSCKPCGPRAVSGALSAWSRWSGTVSPAYPLHQQ